MVAELVIVFWSAQMASVPTEVLILGIFYKTCFLIARVTSKESSKEVLDRIN